jgi:hypothetical protein
MLTLYRLARVGGYSVVHSLAFALFNLPLPTRPDQFKQQMDEHLARLAELEAGKRDEP